MSNEQYTGYPVGNFGIAGEITPSGRVFSGVMYNAPVIGSELEKLGRGQFEFSCDGVGIKDSDFSDIDVQRLFPEASASYTDPRFDGLSIKVDFIAPIAAYDAFTCSLPVLCAEIEFVNQTSREREVFAAFDFLFDVKPEDINLLNAGGFWLVGNYRTRIGFDRAINWRSIEGGLSGSARTLVPPNGTARLRFALVCHDANGYYVGKCPDMGALISYASSNWDKFKRDRAEFLDMLPRTHDEQIDRYLRWYLQAGVLLIRVTREHVLTMGYLELNQRDSFWTSWLHLVLWPDLERRMIEESAEFQGANGKIPTTILPLIEREDDIDINEYFNLRIARYYEWTRDLEFVRKLWPSFKLSIEYLKSMDKDGDGLLDQGSYWGDWKDVWGVEGRKAAPHFEFLYLAVLKSAKELADKLGDAAALTEYSALYERSYEVVNRSTKDGGLWNGKFYTTLWYDGREDNHVQEDQFVGPLYDVMPAERVGSVYEALEPNMTPWGVRDTYPYRENFSHKGGDYHNGGVWVFLNFADALSRFVTGYPKEGYEILRRVGEWDLEKEGDYMPAEFLNGNTGKNEGMSIQGWDADYYAAVFFGIFGVKVLDMNKVQIMPRVPDTESFDTRITLLSGTLRVRQSGGSQSIDVEVCSEIDRLIDVRYGVMTSKSIEGCVEERIGGCIFQVVEFTLGPGETRCLNLS